MDKGALSDLKTSGHLPIHDTCVMDTTAETRNWGMPKTISIHKLSWNWVKQDYLPEKSRNHHYFQAEDTGKYERALAQRKEAIDRLRKI